MSDTIGNLVARRIRGTHKMIFAVTEDLTDAQLAQRPGPTAPPIGWHLWHISRWADRLQASFSGETTGSHDPDSEIWAVEGLAAQWGLNPETLGVLETGGGMDHDDAAALPLTGKRALLEYTRQAFSEANQAVASLEDHRLQESRPSILPMLQLSPAGKLAAVSERESTVIGDLLFHLAHANRHLGMIEALRGAVLEMHGTASV